MVVGDSLVHVTHDRNTLVGLRVQLPTLVASDAEEAPMGGARGANGAFSVEAEARSHLTEGITAGSVITLVVDATNLTGDASVIPDTLVLGTQHVGAVSVFSRGKSSRIVNPARGTVLAFVVRNSLVGRANDRHTLAGSQPRASSITLNDGGSIVTRGTLGLASSLGRRVAEGVVHNLRVGNGFIRLGGALSLNTGLQAPLARAGALELVLFLHALEAFHTLDETGFFVGLVTQGHLSSGKVLHLGSAEQHRGFALDSAAHVTVKPVAQVARNALFIDTVVRAEHASGTSTVVTQALLDCAPGVSTRRVVRAVVKGTFFTEHAAVMADLFVLVADDWCALAIEDLVTFVA